MNDLFDVFFVWSYVFTLVFYGLFIGVKAKKRQESVNETFSYYWSEYGCFAFFAFVMSPITVVLFGGFILAYFSIFGFATACLKVLNASTRKNSPNKNVKQS